MCDLPAKGADQSWQIGGYRFELTRHPVGRRWGVSARGRGVGGCRTPLTALLLHTRHAGLPWYRVPGYGMAYRAAQAWLHSRGYCVLRRGGLPLWSCSWCGNRIRRAP